MSELLRVERDGDLLRVTLNDPERANALSPALAGALVEPTAATGAPRACARSCWRAPAGTSAPAPISRT